MAQQCTARKKRTNRRCRAYAVNGSDKCRVHGGMSAKPSGPYSKYNPAWLELKKNFKLFKELGTNPDSVLEELALTRAMLNHRLEQLKTGDKPAELDKLLVYIDRITKIISDFQKQQNERKIANTVEAVGNQAIDVMEFLKPILQAIAEKITDQRACQQYLLAVNTVMEERGLEAV